MTPSFAVVIPVYNGRKHLAETLDGVLRQTVLPREIVVIEDGSSEPAEEIAARYANVRYVAQENAGVSQARNHGASLATADWICFLDQDDLLMPGHLEQVCEAIALNDAVDVCYSDRLLLSADAGGWATTAAKLLPDAAALPMRLMQCCPFPPSGMCIRRSVFNGSGGFRSRYDLAEDWELWVRLMARGHVFHRCPQATMCYRVHPQSVSHCRPLPILAANLRVIREQILPLLPRWKRFWWGRKIVSRQEAEAAIMLRQTGEAGACLLLARSILRFPFCNLRRYKVAGHMLLTRLGLIGQRRRHLSTAG